jgi:hypothetical protein
MMGAANSLKPMTDWPLILTEGGDCRLPLDPKTGANKYHNRPYVAPQTLFRGSCTCNSPTQAAYDASQKIYESMEKGETTVEEVLHQTRERLITLYGCDQNTGVFLMPSGSDAEYIPLVIS